MMALRADHQGNQRGGEAEEDFDRKPRASHRNPTPCTLHPKDGRAP